MKKPDYSHINQIGNKEDRIFRDSIFDAHQGFDHLLKAHYLKINKRSGKVRANQWLLTTHKRLNWNIAGLKLSSDDESIKSLAKIKAEALEDKVKKAFQSLELPALQTLAETYLKTYGLELPLPKLTRREPSKTEIMEAIAKACEAKWWRRKLRTRQDRELEQLLRELGQVSADHGGYVSGHGLKRRQQQKRRNLESLQSIEAVNQHDTVYTLAELAEKGVANPAIRRFELLARMSGFEELAKESGDVCLFYTLTAPSAYHCMIKRGGKCFKNPKYNGATPRETQDYLNGVWSRVRAEWDRVGIKAYGKVIREPHHDGTPHWHLVLFFPKDKANRATQIFYKHALRVDGKEKGAEENRFLSVKIDPNKGSATGYVVKYVSKNIDGAAIEGEVSDETGEFISDSCLRADAWASLWGIRQFQPVGGASVTAWRELRKIRKSEDLDDFQTMLPKSEKMAAEERAELEQIRQEANAGNWAEYTKLQGGATVKRADQKVRPWNTQTLKQTATENRIEALFGVVMEGAAKAVRGIVIAGKDVLSRFYQWTMREKRTFEKTARSAVTWTCVNNCTGSILRGAG